MLREVGLGPISDVLENFYRRVLECSDELRAQTESPAKGQSPDAAAQAAASEDAAMAQLQTELTQDPEQLKDILRRAPGSGRLAELLVKVRELESHSRGGPYEGVLETIRTEVEACGREVRQAGDAEAQCGLFGENYLLKPLVHYLSCWDVKQRKKLRDEVDWAVSMRDGAYDASMQHVMAGKIASAREEEAKCLEFGEKALMANRAQRDALHKLEKAASLDLKGYHHHAGEFLRKWGTMYRDRLETIQADVKKVVGAEGMCRARRESVERDFEKQLHERAQRLAENARQREQNLRDLRRILEAEIERERELKREEQALSVLQASVERWKRSVKTSDVDMQGRTTLLQRAEETLLSNVKCVDRMRARRTTSWRRSRRSSAAGGTRWSGRRSGSGRSTTICARTSSRRSRARATACGGGWRSLSRSAPTATLRWRWRSRTRRPWRRCVRRSTTPHGTPTK